MVTNVQNDLQGHGQSSVQLQRRTKIAAYQDWRTRRTKMHTASLGVADHKITVATDGVSCTIASQHASSPAAVQLDPGKGNHTVHVYTLLYTALLMHRTTGR